MFLHPGQGLTEGCRNSISTCSFDICPLVGKYKHMHTAQLSKWSHSVPPPCTTTVFLDYYKSPTNSPGFHSFHHLFFHKTSKVILINLKLAHVTILIRAFQGLPIFPHRAKVLTMPSKVMSGPLFPSTCVLLLFLDSSVSTTLVSPGSSNTSRTASSQGDALAFCSA